MKSYKPTYLYIKTHSLTGMKYFGKTTTNPLNYSGSGLYWTRHLSIHGNNVTTEVLGLFTDKVWCAFYALEFSYLNNVVESEQWANLKHENGSDGFEQGHRLNTKDNWSVERREKIRGVCRESMLLKRGIYGLSSDQKSANSKRSGKISQAKAGSHFSEINVSKEFQEKKKQIYAANRHQQGNKNSQYGKMWITHELYGNKKITAEQLEFMLSLGWFRGRSV